MKNNPINSNFTIDKVSWQTAQHELSLLRAQVFMQEQNVSNDDEWDGKDTAATHFLVSNQHGDPIGCARVLVETLNEQPCFHIGRVALIKAYRGQRIGHQLMQILIAWCQQQNSFRPIFLHAQTHRLRFYKRLGFAPKGEVFMDAGIPHIEMWYKTTD